MRAQIPVSVSREFGDNVAGFSVLMTARMQRITPIWIAFPFNRPKNGNYAT
jgi:hypothetical protein